jgi:UDP-GlcNAc:undecaprenyl-phosphate GlcNAc-1-phosphate transferase
MLVIDYQNLTLFLLLTLGLFLFFSNNRIFISKKLGLIDRPNLTRKIHKKATPLIGGVIILTLFFLYFFYLFILNQIDSVNLALIICPIIICFIGIYDDKFSITPNLKLIIIGIILLIFLSLNENLLLKTMYFSSLNKQIYLNKYIALFLSLLCLLLLINALNLSDGINGLATGIGIIWLVYILYLDKQKNIVFIICLLFLLILIFINIYKGKYFLGDSGALILSSYIGLLTLNTYNSNYLKNIITPSENFFILFMIPGIDMFRLFLTRILNKKNPFYGDQKHLHHLLLKKYSLNKTLLIYLTGMAIFILINETEIINSTIIIIAYLILYSIAIKKLNIKV